MRNKSAILIGTLATAMTFGIGVAVHADQAMHRTTGTTILADEKGPSSSPH